MHTLSAAAEATQCCCTNRVLFCSCDRSDLIADDLRREVRSTLEEMDVDVVVIDDLCGLVADRDPRLVTLTSARPMTIVACYPRAVRWLLSAGGVDVAEDEITVLNMRTSSAEEIEGGLVRDLCVRENTELQVIEHDEHWVPWYPVIDYDRCDGCRQCASFCLFGVFATTEQGRVEVANPSACKTNCPACARVCPTGAIIFPKIGEAPINGDEITETTVVGANLLIDMAARLGDDPMAALAQRRKTARRRLLRRDAMARAEAERERCGCAGGPSPAGSQLPTVGGVELPCCPGSSRTQCGES